MITKVNKHGTIKLKIHTIDKKEKSVHMKVIKSGENQIPLYFGNQTLNGKLYYHTGIDLMRKTNRLDTIVAAQNGKVIKIVSNVKGRDLTKGYGNYIELQHGNGIGSKYCHLKHRSIKVKKGQIIKKNKR